MDTGYSLVKYDGGFRVEEYAKGIYTPYRVRDMKWNDAYWLVLYILAGTEGSAIFKYDGVERESLPYPLNPTYHQWPPVSALELGNGYWLIGTFRYVHPELPPKGQEYMKPSLLRYNGVVFTDLTDEFSKSIKKQPGEKAVCGPTFVILMALLLLAIKKRWTDRSWGG
jgi:hypothetical protein